MNSEIINTPDRHSQEIATITRIGDIRRNVQS